MASAGAQAYNKGNADAPGQGLNISDDYKANLYVYFYVYFN